jgi:hypothetical protein
MVPASKPPNSPSWPGRPLGGRILAVHTHGTHGQNDNQDRRDLLVAPQLGIVGLVPTSPKKWYLRRVTDRCEGAETPEEVLYFVEVQGSGVGSALATQDVGNGTPGDEPGKSEGIVV